MAADEEVTETNQTHKGLRWLDVGIILAVAPIVVASLRVVIFTGGDPVLTQVLIENLDVRTLLLGSFFSILPAMAMVASSFLMVEKSLAGRLLGGDKKGRRRWGTLIGGIILLLVVFSNLMWIAAALVVVPIILFVISFVSFLGEKLERERVKNSWKDIFNVQKGLSSLALGQLRDAMIPPLTILIAVLAQFGSMWLPLELVTTQNTSAKAYVLSNSEGWATLLTEQKVILRIPEGAIIERRVCDQGGHTSLISMLSSSKGAEYPECG